jgi:hypothetical protein
MIITGFLSILILCFREASANDLLYGTDTPYVIPVPMNYLFDVQGNIFYNFIGYQLDLVLGSQTMKCTMDMSFSSLAVLDERYCLAQCGSTSCRSSIGSCFIRRCQNCTIASGNATISPALGNCLQSQCLSRSSEFNAICSLSEYREKVTLLDIEDWTTFYTTNNKFQWGRSDAFQLRTACRFGLFSPGMLFTYVYLMFLGSMFSRWFKDSTNPLFVLDLNGDFNNYLQNRIYIRGKSMSESLDLSFRLSAKR